jgi:hypothetical protein
VPALALPTLPLLSVRLGGPKCSRCFVDLFAPADDVRAALPSGEPVVVFVMVPPPFVHCPWSPPPK